MDPEIIVPLGSTAWQWFQPGDRRPMHEVRGQVYRWRDRLLVPTYHPAFLLRKPDHKGYVWKDMRRVLALETAPPTMAAGVIELTGESPGAALF